MGFALPCRLFSDVKMHRAVLPAIARHLVAICISSSDFVVEERVTSARAPLT